VVFEGRSEKKNFSFKPVRSAKKVADPWIKASLNDFAALTD